MVKADGLGLAIVRELVLLHAGQITVRAELIQWQRFLPFVCP